MRQDQPFGIKRIRCRGLVPFLDPGVARFQLFRGQAKRAPAASGDDAINRDRAVSFVGVDDLGHLAAFVHPFAVIVGDGDPVARRKA